MLKKLFLLTALLLLALPVAAQRFVPRPRPPQQTNYYSRYSFFFSNWRYAGGGGDGLPPPLCASSDPGPAVGYDFLPPQEFAETFGLIASEDIAAICFEPSTPILAAQVIAPDGTIITAEEDPSIVTETRRNQIPMVVLPPYAYAQAGTWRLEAGDISMEVTVPELSVPYMAATTMAAQSYFFANFAPNSTLEVLMIEAVEAEVIGEDGVNVETLVLGQFTVETDAQGQAFVDLPEIAFSVPQTIAEILTGDNAFSAGPEFVVRVAAADQYLAVSPTNLPFMTDFVFPADGANNLIGRANAEAFARETFALFDTQTPPNGGGDEPVPPTGEVCEHTVVRGEWLLEIGRDYGMTLGELIDLNPTLVNLNLIVPGQPINVLCRFD